MKNNIKSLSVNKKFHFPSWPGQKRVNGPFGLRVNLSFFHLSITNDGGFTLSHKMLNNKQESSEDQFFSFSFGTTGNRTQVYWKAMLRLY